MRLSLSQASALLVFALTPPLSAQAPKPLTEADLLKTIDTIGGTDPIRLQPLGASTPAPAEAPATPGAAKPGERSRNGETEITSTEGSFDQHLHQAIFTINVFVKNPDFTVYCDKLTAFLKHDDTKDANGNPIPGKAGAHPATPAPALPRATPVGVNGVQPGKPKKEGERTGKAGGLEKAIAEGNVEIVQDKVETDGSITHNVGHGTKAVYEASTGDITLTGKPDVTTGINSCISLEDSVVMILNRGGQMRTSGGKTKTVIRDSSTMPDQNKTNAH